MQRLIEKILSNIEIIYGDEEEYEQYVTMGVNQPYIDKNVGYMVNNNDINDLNKSQNEEGVEADISEPQKEGQKKIKKLMNFI